VVLSRAYFSFFGCNKRVSPVPVAAQSKVWVCGCLPAQIVGSNPTGGHRCLSVLSVVCCQVDVYASG
jgi:hypothetical protein